MEPDSPQSAHKETGWVRTVTPQIPAGVSVCAGRLNRKMCGPRTDWCVDHRLVLKGMGPTDP